MSFLLSLFNIFLNCNMKWGIIVKIWVVIGGKKRIIGGRRGIIGTNSADRAPTDECSVDAVGMHIIIYIATGDGRGVTEMLPEMALIIISRCDFTISGLDLCVAGCELLISFPKICLIVERKRIGMAAKFGMGGKRLTQKAVARMGARTNTWQVMGMVGVSIGMVGRVRRDGWDGHWDDWDGSPCRNGPTQRQLCRSCVFIAQG